MQLLIPRYVRNTCYFSKLIFFIKQCCYVNVPDSGASTLSGSRCKRSQGLTVSEIMKFKKINTFTKFSFICLDNLIFVTGRNSNFKIIIFLTHGICCLQRPHHSSPPSYLYSCSKVEKSPSQFFSINFTGSL